VSACFVGSKTDLGPDGFDASVVDAVDAGAPITKKDA